MEIETEDKDIKTCVKQEYLKYCPLCKSAPITGSSIKQLNSRLQMHQRSKLCIKLTKELKNATK